MEFKRKALNGKAYQIKKMFSVIAYRYDLLNRLLSLGRDSSWRREVAKIIKTDNSNRLIIDLACGTGELSIEIANNGLNVIAVDFCEEMLKRAKNKIINHGLTDRITLIDAPVEYLPFNDNTFDYATIAFGIRNLYDPVKGLQEIYRVLKKGGKLIVLEFSLPKSKIFRRIYLFYFLKVLPFIGKIFTSTDAYYYLADSVIKFPKYEDFVKLMVGVGMKDINYYNLTMGIVSIYIGEK
jgi:demethylmenaquinone methyltransferase/2-methoxy-6-polyprenyl-1,4-benzoquinol methylase